MVKRFRFTRLFQPAGRHGTYGFSSWHCAGQPQKQIIVTSEDYFEFEKFARGVFERLITQFKADTTLLLYWLFISRDLNVVSYLQESKEQWSPGMSYMRCCPRSQRMTRWIFGETAESIPSVLTQPVAVSMLGLVLFSILFWEADSKSSRLRSQSSADESIEEQGAEEEDFKALVQRMKAKVRRLRSLRVAPRMVHRMARTRKNWQRKRLRTIRCSEPSAWNGKLAASIWRVCCKAGKPESVAILVSKKSVKVSWR